MDYDKFVKVTRYLFCNLDLGLFKIVFICIYIIKNKQEKALLVREWPHPECDSVLGEWLSRYINQARLQEVCQVTLM